MGSHSLPQGVFPTQGSNSGLLHGRQILYRLKHQGSLKTSLKHLFKKERREERKEGRKKLVLQSEDLDKSLHLLSLGFFTSQSNCQDTCNTYNNIMASVKPLTYTRATNKACCVFSIGPPPPPRLAFPFPPGEESGLLCSLASAWNWPTEAGDCCLKEERSGIFVLPPFSLLGSSDCVEFISLRPQLLSCSHSFPTHSLYTFRAAGGP